MEKELLLLLAESDVSALGHVRCIAGLYAARNEKGIWIKGMTPDKMDIRIMQLPVKERFLRDDDNRLFLPGSVTPVAIAEELSWQPIHQFIAVEVPVAAMPGIIGTALTMAMVPSSNARKGDALLTTPEHWKAYAEYAPEVRLQALRFAVSANREVLITGDPLPAIPGKEYWMCNQMLLPCGYDFEWPALAPLLIEKIVDRKDIILLFDTNGNWQKIDDHYFVKATRSAIRLTGTTSVFEQA